MFAYAVLLKNRALGCDAEAALLTSNIFSMPTVLSSPRVKQTKGATMVGQE
jgi:hypothetical protein